MFPALPPKPLRDQYRDALAEVLFREAPVSCLRADQVRDELTRRNNAAEIAVGDARRALAAVVAIGYELAPAGTMKALRSLLAEFAAGYRAEQAAGGAPSEVNWDELLERANELLEGKKK